MLARWLLQRRGVIESTMATRLGRVPPASSAEAEALRRFRSFVMLALADGAADTAKPSLDGLRVDASRASRVIGAWVDAAVYHAGPDGPSVHRALDPLRDRFALAMRETGGARRRSGAPRRSARRAVSAAIDRVSDAFIAIDADSGKIADANPAAGALLGCSRDELLGADAMEYVPEEARAAWWTELDAIAEGTEPRRFRARLRDASGAGLAVDASVTRFATRARTLALVVARP